MKLSSDNLQTSPEAVAGVVDQRMSPGQQNAALTPRAAAAAARTPAGSSATDNVVTVGPVGSATYLWTGSTRLSVPQLKPGTTAELPLQV